MPDPTTGPGGADHLGVNTARPRWHVLHIWQIQSVRDILLIVLVLALLGLGAQLQAITVPILVALGLAYLFEPVIAWLTRRWTVFTRTRVVIAVMSLIGLSLAAILLIVVPLALKQGGAFVRNVPRYLEATGQWLSSEESPELLRPMGQQLRELSQGLDGAETADLMQLAQAAVTEKGAEKTEGDAPVVDDVRIRGLIAEEIERREPVWSQRGSQRLPASAIGTTVNTIWAFLSGLVATAFDVIFTVFLVGFFFVIFSTSYPAVLTRGETMLPAKNKERIKELLSKMDLAVSAFVRGRLLISLLLGLVFAIGWTICSVPYALLLGLVVGIFTLVPYLCGIGLPVAWLLLGMESLSAEESGFYVIVEEAGRTVLWWKILLFPAIVFVVAQLLDDYVLSPIIQGKATNLSPAAIVVAVLAGGSLAGLYGMLLAIPAAACIRILLIEVVQPRVQAWLAGERSDPLPLE